MNINITFLSAFLLLTTASPINGMAAGQSTEPKQSLSVKATTTISLPDILSDNMVLQANSEINIWGTAAPNTEITLKGSWSDRTFRTQTDSQGAFTARITTAAASFTPQTLTLSDGKENRTLHNILLGEVWFCSGQSNIEMPLGGAPLREQRMPSPLPFVTKASVL